MKVCFVLLLVLVATAAATAPRSDVQKRLIHNSQSLHVAKAAAITAESNAAEAAAAAAAPPKPAAPAPRSDVQKRLLFNQIVESLKEYVKTHPGDVKSVCTIGCQSIAGMMMFMCGEACDLVVAAING